MTFFLIYYFTIPLVIIGYGFVFCKLVLNYNYKLFDLGFVGLIGFLSLYVVSNLFHFFLKLVILKF